MITACSSTGELIVSLMILVSTEKGRSIDISTQKVKRKECRKIQKMLHTFSDVAMFYRPAKRAVSLQTNSCHI